MTNGKMWTAVLLVLALTVAGCTPFVPVPIPLPVPVPPPMPGTLLTSGDANAEVNAPVAATPEEAIENYLDAYAAADYDALIATTAVATAAREQDFVASVERLGVYAPASMLAPANDDFLVNLNRARLAQQIGSQILALTQYLLAGEMVDLESGAPMRADGEWAEQFSALLDTSQLSGLQLTGIMISAEDIMATEPYQRNVARAAAAWGGDEWTERLASFYFQGREYALGFTLIRYGDAWYVQSQVSHIAGTPTSGIPLD